LKLSVIILNYNVRYFLELCLQSVEAALVDIDSEIIVVDNASEDGSCNMVKTVFPNVKLIENKTNVGFSKGNNIGVAQAKGEYLCILNPDTVVPEDVFLKLLTFAETKKNLGIVGCRLVNGKGEFLPESKRKIPYIKAAFKKLLGYTDDYYANDIKEKDTHEVAILVGAFMLLKKEVYNQVKGFDEDYFMYGEDIDISYKILKHGFKNYYFGKTTILHFKGESTLRDKNYAQRFYGAMQIFYRKHFKRNILFDVFVRLGIKMVYLVRIQGVIKIKTVRKYVFISDKMNPSLQQALPKKVIVQPDMKAIEKESEVIFDAKVISFKKIIFHMEANNIKPTLTYKILPKNSKFVIGSDDAVSRGEIINIENIFVDNKTQ
jgi:GT2 family glycosyltransferase